MPESISFSEGSILFWTGTSTARAVAFVENGSLVLTQGWENRRLGSGQYIDLFTGQRADVQINAAITWDTTIQRIFQSATAVHMNVRHSGLLEPSAGYLLYSGRLDSLSVQGSQGQVVRLGIQYHTNIWSAYGSAY